MRLWHLIVAMMLVAVAITLARDPVGSVAVIVFIVGLGEIVFGLTAIMALFETLGALGEAKDVVAHAEAVAATTVVLGLATAIMTGLFFVGAWLVQVVVA